MRFSVLGSGSRGNSVFVESGPTAILIDAGFSGKELQSRMERIGSDLQVVDGLFVTHEHNDHIAGAGVISRRCKIPIHANIGTFRGSERKIGKPHKFVEFETGDVVDCGDLQVRSFRVSHDTADPVGYVISDGVISLGYLTDTGKVSHLMAQRLASCSGLILEFNHNLELLKNGPYPLPLQQRVRSSRGHLSNEDAGLFLSELLSEKLKVVVLAHLSETNNTPALATEAAVNCGADWGTTQMLIGSQSTPLPLIKL